MTNHDPDQVWWSLDWENRDFIAMPCEMKWLKRAADEPANHKSRKPGRLIYLYTLGWSKADILADLHIDERTVAKYFQKWVDYGLNAVMNGLCEPSLAEYVADCEEMAA